MSQLRLEIAVDAFLRAREPITILAERVGYTYTPWQDVRGSFDYFEFKGKVKTDIPHSFIAGQACQGPMAISNVNTLIESAQLDCMACGYPALLSFDQIGYAGPDLVRADSGGLFLRDTKKFHLKYGYP